MRITGGNDKDGFPMRQGVLVKGRVRLLLDKNQKTYRPRRTGERKRKSVRGCIVGSDIGVIAVSIVKKGEKDIPGLTDVQQPRRLGPKRANKLRKLFALKKTDDVALLKKNVIRRKFTAKNGKTRQKAPKIQRLVTEDRLRRKRIYKKEKQERWAKSRSDIENYQKMVSELNKKKANERKASRLASQEAAVQKK